MKLSLRTKFYLYVLPLLIVLPVLLYSLVSPYTQLRQAFDLFEEDARQTLLMHEFIGALDEQYLELLHELLALKYGEPGEAMHARDENQTLITDRLREMAEHAASNAAKHSESRAIVLRLEIALGELQALTDEARAMGARGDADGALDLAIDTLGPLLDDRIISDMERLTLLKSEEVATRLPFLADTLTRRGVFSVPGVQQQIEDMLIHFRNAVEARQVAQMLDHVQSDLFAHAITHGSEPEAGEEVHKVRMLEQRAAVPRLLRGMRERLEKADPEETDEPDIIRRIEEEYGRFVGLSDEALARAERGASDEVIGPLLNQLFSFVNVELHPVVKDLVAKDSQYITVTIIGLKGKIALITNVIYGVSITVLLIGFGSLWRLSREVIDPIIALRKAATRLARGDFTARAPVTSSDEIGELSQAFNDMAERLKESYRDLEQRVREQTVRLSDQVRELEAGRKATLNLLEDLNEEKAVVERERAKDEAILGSIGDAVFAIDAKGSIMLFNPVAEALSGFSAKEAVGRRYDEVLHFVAEEGGKPSFGFVETALGGKKTGTSAPLLLVNKNGKRTPVADSAAPIFEKGKVAGAVVVFRDVTRERAVDKAKSEFVSLASHQLRTPLSAINWYAELLADPTSGSLTDEQRGFVGQVSESSRHMVDLVNSLLNVSRIDLGTLASDPKQTDVAALCKNVARELAPQIAERKTKVSEEYPQEGLVMNVDPQLMRIIFQNLLSNAIKYTPEGGSVSISLSSDEKYMRFAVADTGYGIPKADQEKIFGKLYRADNAREKEPDGNGLGLYMVKAIVEQHGGKVWFESEEGKGTTFHVELPRSGMRKIEGSRTLTA